MSFTAILKNKIPAKISEFTVSSLELDYLNIGDRYILHHSSPLLLLVLEKFPHIYRGTIPHTCHNIS